MSERPVSESREVTEFRKKLGAYKSGVTNLITEMHQKNVQTEVAHARTQGTVLADVFQNLPDADAEEVNPVLSAWIREIDPTVQFYLATEDEQGEPIDKTLTLTY